MARALLASPDDQGATFVELFFDLVFVFAVTQVAHHASHHLDAWTLFSTTVVFWLVWWAWTQFTWALNAADTNRHAVRLGTLVATGVAFVMSASVEQAFTADAIWFAGAYVLVRVIGLALYLRVSAHDPAQLAGVRTFAVWSALGLLLVLVGAFVPSSVRPWVWLGVVVLDLVAALAAGRHRDWNLHVEHFAERHGLIVIIALGEALIVAGAGVQGLDRTPALLLEGILGVTITCLLWWTYFGWVKDALEHRVAIAAQDREETMARDAYTFLHFPLVCGIVSFAIGLIGLVGRGEGDVRRSTALALAIGVCLFVGSTALAVRRTTGKWLVARLGITAGTAAAMVLAAPCGSLVLFGILCAGLIVVIAVEHGCDDPERCTRTAS